MSTDGLCLIKGYIVLQCKNDNQSKSNVTLFNLCIIRTAQYQITPTFNYAYCRQPTTPD